MFAAFVGVLGAALGVGVLGLSFYHDVVRLFHARELLRQGGVLLDVERESEFAARHPHLARNIPLDELLGRAHQLGEKTTSIVVYAHRWRDGIKAVHVLRSLGFQNVFDVAGVSVKEQLSVAAAYAEAAQTKERHARGVPDQIELSPREHRAHPRI
jgi:rhodanese-related sulfurtransferase